MGKKTLGRKMHKSVFTYSSADMLMATNKIKRESGHSTEMHVKY